MEQQSKFKITESYSIRQTCVPNCCLAFCQIIFILIVQEFRCLFEGLSDSFFNINKIEIEILLFFFKVEIKETKFTKSNNEKNGNDKPLKAIKVEGKNSLLLFVFFCCYSIVFIFLNCSSFSNATLISVRKKNLFEKTFFLFARVVKVQMIFRSLD